MRAAFSTAVDDSADILEHAVKVLRMGANGDMDPGKIADLCRLLGPAIASLDVLAASWRAVDAVMSEVEADR